MRTLNLFAQKLAARAGFFRLECDLSPTAAKHAARRIHAAFLQSVLTRYAVDCVIDVGANQGQFAAALRSGGYHGVIVSFEPVREPFEALRRNAQHDPRWHVRPETLGAREESRTLHVMRRSEFSSLLPPAPDQPAVSAGKNLVVRTETVLVRRLDALSSEIPALAQSRRMLLKLDTQGSDLDVFAGAAGLLERVVALQSELSMIPLYHDMPHFTQVLARFEEAGFSVCSLAPVVRDPATLAVIECDCLLLRRGVSP